MACSRSSQAADSARHFKAWVKPESLASAALTSSYALSAADGFPLGFVAIFSIIIPLLPHGSGKRRTVVGRTAPSLCLTSRGAGPQRRASRVLAPVAQPRERAVSIPRTTTLGAVH